jgi:acetylornithine deacetylase/succinyl-diaminopimelate desuccinylase-like protein
MGDEQSRQAGDGVAPRPDEPDLAERAVALLRSREIQAARRYLLDTDARTLREQWELTEIPAPPFGEEPRGRRMAELMDQAGLVEVRADTVGNVLGRLPGPEGPPFIIAAHLDTVFPPGTDVRVRHEGDRLRGPGISDDGRGLAALLALARTLVSCRLSLRRAVLFVATVGEEGSGDLRGVRHLFGPGGPGDQAAGFISLDGAGLDGLVTSGLGSIRYRFVARGSGGHSWVDWGTPNPVHALGAFVAAATALDLPTRPTTTLTVGRWGGGTSINVIPQEAWVELEVRSEAAHVLDEMDEEVQRLAHLHVARTNERSAPGTAPVTLRVEDVGRRPVGATDASSLLVRSAMAATAAVGATPGLALSSTDANVPMSLGIPSLTMGAGGEAGHAHTTREWYRNVNGPDGILRALLTVLLATERDS